MKILIYEKEKVIKELDFFVQNKMSVERFYADIKNAIKSNNMQSIWQLSKIITRYQISKK